MKSSHTPKWQQDIEKLIIFPFSFVDEIINLIFHFHQIFLPLLLDAKMEGITSSKEGWDRQKKKSLYCLDLFRWKIRLFLSPYRCRFIFMVGNFLLAGINIRNNQITFIPELTIFLRVKSEWILNVKRSILSGWEGDYGGLRGRVLKGKYLELENWKMLKNSKFES